MCIIIAKKKGVKFPSKKNVRNACQNNPDGFAMCWYDDSARQVNIFRTLDEDLFLKKYNEVFKLDFKTTSLVIHARIATHGTVKLENTHCFSDKDSGLVFSHNGILNIKNRGDMTDSETFFRDLFLPALAVGGWEAGERAIDACIGSSKFAIMDSNGDIYHYGQYITDKGVLYSNTSYQERVWATNTYTNSYVYGEDYIWDRMTGKYIYRKYVTKKQWEQVLEDNKYLLSDDSYYDDQY